MPTVRDQQESQVAWTGAATKSIPADGVFVNSDDFVVDGDMINIGFTFSGNSVGSDSNDIVELHCKVKRDANNNNGGVPDTYDNEDIFITALDCSDGSFNQKSDILEKVMAGDTLRFACRSNGTNAIVIGVRLKEDLISF